MNIMSKNEAQTQKVAADFAKTLLPGTIVFLRGTLGAGKSVFARSVIRALTDDQTLEVPSPTFTLVQIYESPAGPLWHFDLYRLKDPAEIYELGWEEALGQAILLIEWPARLGPLKPARYTDIHFTHVKNKPQTRMIHMEHIGQAP